jgi:hypothetical protein
MEHARHPLNAPGDFYVESDLCFACTAPEHEAPDFVGHCEDGPANYHCYFKRQPSTPEETAQAIRAVRVGCCGAVRYGGRDPAIIAKLVELGSSDDCDMLEQLDENDARNP